MYDPKFSQKQMYDQYGRSRSSNNKVDPKPSKSSGFGGMGPDPAERFGGSPTRGIGAKPSSTNTFGTNTFGGGQDNNPNRDESENKSTVAKVYEKTVDFFKSFGADEPKDVIVDGKRVYQGPAFRGYDPTTRIGQFGGEYGKQQYLFDAPKLGIEVTRSPVPPTLPPSTINMFGVNTDNPRLNMFGVNRGSTRPPAAPELPTSPDVPANMDPMTRVLSQAMLPTEVNYTIKDGDTLSEIARDAGATVQELKELNNIDDINIIDAGDTLKIPVKASKLTDTQAALRGGFDRPKDNQGVETAMDLSKLSVTELMNLLKSVNEKLRGEDTTTATVGLMSKPNNVDPTGLEGPESLQDFTDVTTAQIRLAELGYNIGRGGTSNLRNLKIVNSAETKPSEIRGVDGIKGKNTTAAIKEFQKDNNLLVTGKLDSSTVAALANPKKPTLKMDDKKYSTTKQNDNMRRVYNEAIKQGITGLELVSLMSQIAHESADFKRTEEYASGSAYEDRADLGNTQKGDGVKYKGRSFIQITGRTNYKKIGDKLGLDLINNPTLLEDPDTAAKATVLWWKDNVQPLVGDFSDVERVTKIINGGFNGLSDRKNNFNEFLTRE